MLSSTVRVVGWLSLTGVLVAACASSEATDPGGAGAATQPEDASAPSPDGGPRGGTDAGASAADAADASDAEGGALDAGPKPPFSCQDATFPGVLPVPEASTAAEVELLPGVRELLVTSDSGRGGAALAIALPGAGSSRALTLPLDPGASDDTEGSAWRAGRLYTLASSGAVRRFAPDGTGGLVRDQDVYRIGLEPGSCPDLTAVNCGRNYEGLCLRAPASTHPCAGYAASKAEGKLYCVSIDGAGKLFLRGDVAPLALGLPADQLSDCAFGAAGGPAEDVLVVTTNVFGLSRSYRVDEATGTLARLPSKALVNVEAAAIDRDGALYVFDDNSTAQSTAAKASCIGW